MKITVENQTVSFGIQNIFCYMVVVSSIEENQTLWSATQKSKDMT